jgi:hypothetical protein
MTIESPIYATVVAEVTTSVAAATASLRPEEEQISVIQGMGIPKGIAREFVRSTAEFAKRYWIIDNSGSMATADGHVIQEGPGGRQGMVTCSRWEELGANIGWHARLAVEIGAYTEFRLLNQPARGGPQIVRVGTTVSHFIPAPTPPLTFCVPCKKNYLTEDMLLFQRLGPTTLLPFKSSPRSKSWSTPGPPAAPRSARKSGTCAPRSPRTPRSSGPWASAPAS